MNHNESLMQRTRVIRRFNQTLHTLRIPYRALLLDSVLKNKDLFIPFQHVHSLKGKVDNCLKAQQNKNGRRWYTCVGVFVYFSVLIIFFFKSSSRQLYLSRDRPTCNILSYRTNQLACVCAPFFKMKGLLTFIFAQVT